ncbi:MAG: hypothetical protein U0359_33275 [Byssovorax sp.]
MGRDSPFDPGDPASRQPPRLDRWIVTIAVVAFLALGAGMTERMMVFSEELMMLPTPAARVLANQPDASGKPVIEPSCRDTPRPRYVLSESRPTFALCAGDRSYPVMTAPQFAGLFLWPIALLRPLHHDDPFLIRKILLALGVASILLASKAVRRFSTSDEGDRGSPSLAALAAIGVAVSPCFVLIGSIIQTFETLPWVFTVAAVLVFSSCPELHPRPEGQSPTEDRSPSSAKIALGAFLAGLALLANVKAVFFLVPLLLLAIRLRARVFSLRPAQWALALASGTLALTPMLLPIALDPSMRWAQGRGPDWKDRLIENLAHPGRILDAVRDLVLLFSNFGHYLARTTLNPVSFAVAALVTLFVIADTARTLVRRRGSVVVAACGTLMIAYVLVVTLLYTEFPANYTPLHAVYGIALGAAAHRLARALSPRTSPRAASALSLLVFVPFAWNTIETMRAVAEIPFVTNARAERDLSRYLAEHAEPRASTVSINLLAGGVVDALSGGRVETLQAHEWLRACESRAERDRAPACFRERFRALLDREARGGDVRVIFPTDLSLVRRPDGLDQVQRTALGEAARDLGLDLRVEETFFTPSGAPAILLFRAGLSR